MKEKKVCSNRGATRVCLAARRVYRLRQRTDTVGDPSMESALLGAHW